MDNLGLVKHAQMALHEKWGYVWSTFGKVLTPAILTSILKQYPNNVCAYEAFIRQNWMRCRTTDCVGLMKSYIWWTANGPVYKAANDINANMAYDRATAKGPINTIPKTVGTCVYKKGHIGVYEGNGYVIEAAGTKRGVVRTPLRGAGSTPWTHWLEYPGITYIKEEVLRFKDVDKDRWSYKAIEEAATLGLIEGDSSNNFNPTANVTREQIATMFVRLYNKIKGEM